MKMNNEAYERMKVDTDSYAARYGPTAVLLAVLAYFEENNLGSQSRILEDACRKLGVPFKKKSVPSMTDWDKQYTITLMPDGKHSCACKGWIFCKIPNTYYTDRKWCKHLEAYANNPNGWETSIDLNSLPSLGDMKARAAAAGDEVTSAPAQRKFRIMG